jgi:hypothetical protein
VIHCFKILASCTGLSKVMVVSNYGASILMDSISYLNAKATECIKPIIVLHIIIRIVHTSIVREHFVYGLHFFALRCIEKRVIQEILVLVWSSSADNYETLLILSVYFSIYVTTLTLQVNKRATESKRMKKIKFVTQCA